MTDFSNLPQSRPAAPDNAPPSDDKTRVVPRSISANTSAATILAPRPKVPDTRHSQHNASGFAEAQAIARDAKTGSDSGSLLKNRFLLESILGEGGMGTVYKTKDLRKVEAEDPNPYIATKVLNPGFREHPNAFVTLQQEAAKSHTLAHPNIVTVHDFDRDGDTLFMTMELLDGEPLDQLINAQLKTGIAKETALAIVRDMCSALAYAHQRHIIHADFKPGNVFVCADGTTKVLDFGIARAASKETQRHTFDTAQLGALTPAYATIELVNNEPLTFSDDVYALACVTYEVLTGRHPYLGKSALEAKQLTLKPAPVTALSHKEWKALQHGLALDKCQRTATVPEFMAELFPHRRSKTLLLTFGLLGISIAGLAWFSYSQQQEKRKLQNTINENIVQAQTCFAQHDFACAIERSLIATNLDANNLTANQLLKNAQVALQQQQISNLLADGENCLAAQDDGCAQVKAREALTFDPNNARAQQLLSAASVLAQDKIIISDIQQAEACLAGKNFSCAEMLIEKSSAINSNHPEVKSLRQKMQAMQAEIRRDTQALQQRLSLQITAANDCLLQKKYDCAIRQANAALSLDAANHQALEIKQTASLQFKQHHDDAEKVKKILAQAHDCLEKQKNYSCTIAKAEAALDVMPNNLEAIAIKTRAQDIQRKIKETGFNIK